MEGVARGGGARLLLPLSAAALALEGAWLATAALGDLRRGATIDLLGLLLAAALVFVLALALVARAGRLAPADEARALALIALAGVAFRLTLLPTTPTLSDDVWRYAWEGRVQATLGANPYALAPDDPALAAARDAAWSRVNHREVPAVYGPLLELLFAGLARLPGELAPLRATFAAADVLAFVLVARALRRAGRSPLLALAWAWHPLVVLELAGQAHLEVVPIALLLLALDLAATGRLRLAALALGAAAAAKYLPLLVAPALLARGRSWRERAGLAALALLPLALCALPYADAPGAPGVATFAQRWRANALGYGLLAWGLEGSGLSAAFCRRVVARVVDVPPGFDPAAHLTWLEALPRLVAGLLAAGAALLVARTRDVERAALVAGAAFVALSPVVHPWYALWLVPLLPLRERGAGPWLLLTLTVPLGYVSLVGYDGTEATWREPLWARLCIGLPVAAWLVVDRTGPRGWTGGPPAPTIAGARAERP